MPKLSIHVLGDGERVPILHDADGLPLFYPMLFATTQLRNAGAAVNTIRNKCGDIVVLLRWEQRNGRDLINEFSNERFLSGADIDSLRDFAHLDMRYQAFATSAVDEHEPGVVDFLESRIASRAPEATVGGQQHYNRISSIAQYLEFTASVVTQHRNSPKIAQEISRMARALRKNRPRGLSKLNSDEWDERSPPTALIDAFMAVGCEGDPRNPFRHPDVRLRNSIIFELFRHTGMRRGELLSLRIDQIDLGHEPTIWVRRNHDDAHDPRPYQPVAKTKERPLPLTEALANKLDRYIMRVRANIVPARRHAYLFVSHRRGDTWGRPLSTSALNSQIFARMRSVDPAFKKVFPHAFRHHFNYELSKSIDDLNVKARGGADGFSVPPITEARELDVRAFLNGHRSKASGAVYNKRHIRETSDKAIRHLQAGLKGNIKDSLEDNEPV